LRPPENIYFVSGKHKCRETSVFAAFFFFVFYRMRPFVVDETALLLLMGMTMVSLRILHEKRDRYKALPAEERPYCGGSGQGARRLPVQGMRGEPHE